MIIEVTQEDIAKGISRSTCACPVALAVSRHLGLNWVSFETVTTLNGTKYRLPSKAIEFVQFFDVGREVKPFSFQLEPSLEVRYGYGS